MVEPSPAAAVARRFGIDPGGSLDPSMRSTAMARVAAALLLTGGALTALTAAGIPEHVRYLPLMLVAATATLVGFATWVAPWHRWHPRSTLMIAPIALGLIALGNLFGSKDPFDYGVYFVVVHVWVGLAHPPGSSLLIAPLTTVAYLLPLLVVASDPGTAMASAITVVPLSVLVGESVSWVVRMLDRSERQRAGLQATLDHERTVLEQLEDARAQLEFAAYHDSVTGLPNRAFFEQHLLMELSAARRRHERVAVCVLDLDKFKLVNDTAGHATGDAFLGEVARRLRASLRDEDLVARVGGDEFLVAAPIPNVETAAPASEVAARMRRRLLDALEQPFRVAGAEFSMSASIGVGVMPDDGVDATSLFRVADTKMYREKRRRAHGVALGHVDEDEDDRFDDMAPQLRMAARRGDWDLAFQPIVELVLERTVGAEALLRWPGANANDNGSGSSIGPATFIPIAEELGLMHEIGSWVTDQLPRRCAEWQARGVLDDLHMLSFNVSPRELWHPGLGDRVGAAAEAIGRPNLLVAEITESALSMDPARARSTLCEIRSHGVRVALDDFGSGHSSLGRMRELPIDLVKIDRSFLAPLDDDPAARSMVRAILRLCQGLGVVALAEGVERRSQADFLAEEGCLLAQGYLYGEPGPATEVTAQLRRAESVTILEHGSDEMPSGANPCVPLGSRADVRSATN